MSEFVCLAFYSVCTTFGFGIPIYHPGCILFGGIFMVLLSTSEDWNKSKRNSCFPLYIGHWTDFSFAMWDWSCHYSTYSYIYTMNCSSSLSYHRNRICIFWDTDTRKYLNLLKISPSLLTLTHEKPP